VVEASTGVAAVVTVGAVVTVVAEEIDDVESAGVAA